MLDVEAQRSEIIAVRIQIADSRSQRAVSTSNVELLTPNFKIGHCPSTPVLAPAADRGHCRAMLSVLESPTFRARVSRLSVTEYHQLGEYNECGKRTELIRGIVVEKTGKSPLHCTIVSILQHILTPQVPQDFCVRQYDPLTLRDSEPEPDLAIVAGTHGDFFHAHPTTAALAIEIAVTNPDDDHALAEIYAEAGVGEYWVVLPKERAIEVFRQPEGLAYREVCRCEFADELECSTVPGVKLALAELFAGIAPAGA